MQTSRGLLFVYLFGFCEGICSCEVPKQKNVQLVGFFRLPGGRLEEENNDGVSGVG